MMERYEQLERLWHFWCSQVGATEKVPEKIKGYLWQLSKQDEKASTGSIGKLFDVFVRWYCGKGRLTKKDVHCRAQSRPDFRKKLNGTMIQGESKTSFAQWAYGDSAEESWHNLLKMQDKIMVWLPYPKEEPEKVWVFKMDELLAYLTRYNPEKGLAVWFSYKKPTEKRGGQLQLQPVVNSAKRRAYLEQASFEIGYDFQTMVETCELD